MFPRLVNSIVLLLLFVSCLEAVHIIHPTYRVPLTNPVTLRARRSVESSDILTPTGQRVKTVNANHHDENVDVQATWSQVYTKQGIPLLPTYEIKGNFKF
ncbi:hypothetical protein HHI36_020527 [Cryptolaemus montrouzieri]|uniref:Secreted protein n=1 Tax=Cryptolaemus montrouzieri TaxID=559131 RepID=A0ABD2NAY0_9CUCU